MKTIGFIGLGKLGLPVALAVESRGFKVVGYDFNPKIKEYLKLKKVPFVEAGLDPLLSKTKLQLLSSIEEVVRKSDLVFCTIQTPHEPEFEGNRRLPKKRADFDYSFLVQGIKDIVATNHNVTLVVISTCLPGTYRREIAPLLSRHVNYIYNPFFIAMGTVISDFLNPEFVLIGQDRKHSSAIRDFYLKIHGQDKTLITDITTAEGIKVFYNTFITTKTVLGNMYGEFAYRMGMNVDDIFKALSRGTDRLISAKYLKAGVADGGGCHPRDNIALSCLAKKIGLSFNLFDSLMTAREKHMEWLAQLFVEKVKTKKLPGVILGKSFKPETNITTGSAAILLSRIVKESKIKFSHYEFDYPKKLPVGVYFIATQHERYKKLSYPSGSVIIDPFRYIPKHEGVAIIAIGRGNTLPNSVVMENPN
jgi:UDPglucose 6-dehydrogenase